MSGSLPQSAENEETGKNEDLKRYLGLPVIFFLIFMTLYSADISDYQAKMKSVKIRILVPIA